MEAGSVSDQTRRGRPPLDRSGAAAAAVHLKLPAKVYDSAYEHARARRESVQDTIRRGLTRLLRDERGGSF
jgi:hypothetical protein